MDIHAPDKPVHSLKDFGIHIAIVTIGILIALSLEGIRESIHDHHLVRETRDNFQIELISDRTHATHELARDREVEAELQQLLQDLPTLARTNPAGIAPRLNAINSSFYFIGSNSWQTALSTGALAHMSTAEVSRYSNTFYLIRIYADFERDGLTAENSAKSFVSSRTTFSPADLAEATQRILLFLEADRIMVSSPRQMVESFGQVLPPEKPGSSDKD